MRSLCLALVLLPALAHAETSLYDEPRVFSIQQRPFRLGHEFQLGLGVLPTDAFYIGTAVDFSYTYHFTDFWGWEIVNLAYSQNFDTSLRDELLEKYGVEPVGGGGERIKLIGTTSLVVKPLFGKLAIFNEDMVQSETFFSAGLGAMLKGDYPRFVIDLGMGLRFWSSQVLSVRFDIKDYLIFTTLVPENAIMFALSGSFNFFNEPEKPAVSAKKPLGRVKP